MCGTPPVIPSQPSQNRTLHIKLQFRSGIVSEELERRLSVNHDQPDSETLPEGHPFRLGHTESTATLPALRSTRASIVVVHIRISPYCQCFWAIKTRVGEDRADSCRPIGCCLGQSLFDDIAVLHANGGLRRVLGRKLASADTLRHLFYPFHDDEFRQARALPAG